MGFVSLVTTVIGMAIMSQSGKTYAVRWEGAVAVGKRMANAIIEYVGGIQVVKAFSQSAGSYKKYSGAVERTHSTMWTGCMTTRNICPPCRPGRRPS